MTGNYLRRGLLALACVVAALLSACGDSTIASTLKPTRIIVFGDSSADVGEVGGQRWTVNDGSVNVWAEQVANSYGQPLTPASQGGLGYASGGARVADVAAQMDAFLAHDSFGANDLVLVSMGVDEVYAQAAAYIAGQQSYEQLLAGVDKAGRDYGAQVKRLVDAGAKYVIAGGTWDLGNSPYALQIAQPGLLKQLSYAGQTCTGCPRSFNEALLISINSLGNHVLYVDAANYFNSVYENPIIYLGSGANVTDMVCTVQPVTGCTPATVLAGVSNYNLYLFAGPTYTTPNFNQLLGEYAYKAISSRW